MTPQPQKYSHQSRFIRSHSVKGIRLILAEERRIRRRAERFALKAKKDRHIGWALICKATGGTLVERQFDWQLDEYLDLLRRNTAEQKLLQCQLNIWKLKAALQELAETEDRIDEMLWGAE